MGRAWCLIHQSPFSDLTVGDCPAFTFRILRKDGNMSTQPAVKRQGLQNVVNDFSNLLFDYLEIRNNLHNEVSTEDEAKDEIIYRTSKTAFIPKEEINKVIEESRRGKELWDKLVKRLGEIRQRFEALTLNKLPEIFTSERCPRIENPANVLCFISEIENEFKEEKPYLTYTSTYEAAFKNFLLNKLKDMTDRWMEKWGEDIEELNQTGGWRQRIREWGRRNSDNIATGIIVTVVGGLIVALIVDYLF